MSLQTVPFGKTGLSMPRIGLGLAALGRPGYINLGHSEDLAADNVVEAMMRRTHRLLDLAYQKGIRYFDTARSYGKAENFLQKWLDTHQPAADALHVGSKWGYTYTADWQVVAQVHEVKNHTIEVLQEQWKASKTLQPYLKLYQIHSATFESGVLENSAVLNELAKLKAAGVLIGLSVSGAQQAEVIEAALMIRVDGVYLFDAVQATYNILESSTAYALEQAAESGMGVIIKEALANGRLTPRNQNATFESQKQALEELAKKYAVDIDAIALAYVLGRPWAHLVLSGAATGRHLLSNLDALSFQLEDAEIEHLASFAEPAKLYWQKRSDLKWN